MACSGGSNANDTQYFSLFWYTEKLAMLPLFFTECSESNAVILLFFMCLTIISHVDQNVAISRHFQIFIFGPVEILVS